MAKIDLAHTTRQSLLQITSRAEELSRLIVQQREAPTSNQTNLSDRIRNLNHQISQFIEWQNNTRMENNVTPLGNLNKQLDTALKQFPTATAPLVKTLSLISEASKTLIPPSSPPPLLPTPLFSPIPRQLFPPVPSRFDPYLEFSLPQDINEAPVLPMAPADENTDLQEDLEQERAMRELDSRIFHGESRQLEVADLLVFKLNSKDPWKQAIDSRDPKFIEIFPGLLEGYLIQESASYEEYRNFCHWKTTITKEDYDNVRALSLDQEFGKVFQDDDLSPLMIKLKLLGSKFSHRKNRLIELVLSSRQKEIFRQRKLIEKIQTLKTSRLHKELIKAIDNQCIVFIEAALQFRMKDIQQRDLDKLFVWLAGRGRTTLLNKIISERNDEVSQKAYFKAFDRAFKWQHDSAFDLLFEKYLYHSAPEDLLSKFAIRGNERGLSKILSSDYGYEFSQGIIDEAFIKAKDEYHYHALRYFLYANRIPSQNALATVFQTLCDRFFFYDLMPFFKNHILSKIPSAKESLNRGFDRLLDEDAKGNDNYSIFFDFLDFFLDSRVCKYLDDSVAMKIAQKVLDNYDMSSEEILSFFKDFAKNPLFKSLTEDNLKDLIIDTIDKDEVETAEFLISQAKQLHFFENLLIRCANQKNEYVLSLLLDHRKSKKINARFIGGFLWKVVSLKFSVKTVKKILKLNHSHSLPPSSMVESFRIAADNKNYAIVKALLKHKPAPILTLPELESFLSHLLDSERFRTAALLVSQPEILNINARLISRILWEAARFGVNAALKIRFRNLSAVPPTNFAKAILTALAQGHIECAQTLFTLREEITFKPDELQECAVNAAIAGNMPALEFLYIYFPTQMTRSITEAAHAAASHPSNGEVTHFLWNKILQFRERPDFPLDGEPRKRARQ